MKIVKKVVVEESVEFEVGDLITTTNKEGANLYGKVAEVTEVKEDKFYIRYLIGGDEGYIIKNGKYNHCLVYLGRIVHSSPRVEEVVVY